MPGARGAGQTTRLRMQSARKKLGEMTPILMSWGCISVIESSDLLYIGLCEHCNDLWLWDLAKGRRQASLGKGWWWNTCGVTVKDKTSSKELRGRMSILCLRCMDTEVAQHKDEPAQSLLDKNPNMPKTSKTQIRCSTNINTSWHWGMMWQWCTQTTVAIKNLPIRKHNLRYSYKLDNAA